MRPLAAAWARQNGRPTVATLQRRTGTVWTGILAAAGGEPNAAKVKNRSRAEVGEYVTRFLAAHPTAATVEYARGAPQHGAPSLSTVTGRFAPGAARWRRAGEEGRREVRPPAVSPRGR